MVKVNIHEAKTQLSRLLARVARGEQVIIARAGKPIAFLLPYQEQKQARALGRYSGPFEVPADFDAPLSEDLLRGFES